ncbi:hypothetical protein GIB67_019121 [Kingdonia uniflora]|uniref:Alpha/beta hydrolase fold-3 domain-containing protein n=1 Tax=Kingdonia uniflora TaxID=39325 RepID=A0A7J7N030_9MAGN|nr:hypothetical protein GIB67_019121 [Kingdonia uniflora]
MPSGNSNIDPWSIIRCAMNPDGTLQRLLKFPTIPASGEGNVDPGQSHVSRDVPLNPENGTWFRIYRPTKIPSRDSNVAKIPVILYFHMGGFIYFHPDTMIINKPCGRFASELPCIVLSLDYRLAPENRLPAAYDDALELLYWLKQQTMEPNGDPWLRDYADFSRCYLMGCSAGATIAYRTGLCSTDLDLEPVNIAGIIMNQPLFGGEIKTTSEIALANDMTAPSCAIDLMWKLVLPAGANQDHEYSNPMVQGDYTDNLGKLPKVLIRGFEGDPLLDRMMQVTGMLIKNKVRVTAYFDDIGFHCVDFLDPKRHLRMINFLKEFMEQIT